MRGSEGGGGGGGRLNIARAPRTSARQRERERAGEHFRGALSLRWLLYFFRHTPFFVLCVRARPPPNRTTLAYVHFKTNVRILTPQKFIQQDQLQLICLISHLFPL